MMSHENNKLKTSNIIHLWMRKSDEDFDREFDNLFEKYDRFNRQKIFQKDNIVYFHKQSKIEAFEKQYKELLRKFFTDLKANP